MKKFYDMFDEQDLIETLTNKYLVFFKYRLEKEILISSEYEIIMRNVNEIEMKILSQTLSEKIYDILKLSDKLNDFLDKEKSRYILRKYIKKFFDYNDRTIICFELDGHDLYCMMEKIIKIIQEFIFDYISEKNYKNISLKIAHRYLENFIVLYSKNEKRIYELIQQNEGMTREQIDIYDRYDEFIFKYIEFWNAINFKQYEFLGIKILNFNTRINTVLDIYDVKELSYLNECIKVFDKPYCIDIKDEKLFYFILKKFNSDYYLDDDNKILLYFSLIELLITHKPKNYDDSITSQLKENIICCVNKCKDFEKTSDINISRKEIGFLYDYRSILVHGELDKTKKLLKRIEKEEYFKKFIIEYQIEDNELKEMSMIDIMRSRVLEIFSCVYKVMIFDAEYIKEIKYGNLMPKFAKIFKRFNKLFKRKRGD